jgi:hypothetical protein
VIASQNDKGTAISEEKREKEKKKPKPLTLVAHAKTGLEDKSGFWADRLPPLNPSPCHGPHVIPFQA